MNLLPDFNTLLRAFMTLPNELDVQKLTKAMSMPYMAPAMMLVVAKDARCVVLPFIPTGITDYGNSEGGGAILLRGTIPMGNQAPAFGLISKDSVCGFQLTSPPELSKPNSPPEPVVTLSATLSSTEYSSNMFGATQRSELRTEFLIGQRSVFLDAVSWLLKHNSVTTKILSSVSIRNETKQVQNTYGDIVAISCGPKHITLEPRPDYMARMHEEIPRFTRMGCYTHHPVSPPLTDAEVNKLPPDVRHALDYADRFHKLVHKWGAGAILEKFQAAFEDDARAQAEKERQRVEQQFIDSMKRKRIIITQ